MAFMFFATHNCASISTVELIRGIWDGVEFAFRKESLSSIRDKARELGMFYAEDAAEVGACALLTNSLLRQ